MNLNVAGISIFIFISPILFTFYFDGLAINLIHADEAARAITPCNQGVRVVSLAKVLALHIFPILSTNSVCSLVSQKQEKTVCFPAVK